MTSTRSAARRARSPAASGGVMTFGRHLAELRKRLAISIAAVLVAMVVAFIFTDPVIYALTAPIRMLADERGQDMATLNFDSVTSAFDLRMRIALAVGFVIAGPVWLAQVWLFLMPALSRREITYALGFVGAAIPLFFGGCVVGWMIAPHAIMLMAGFVPDGGAMFFQYSYYYDFVLKLVIVVGIAFVLPLILVMLNAVGVLTAREILKGWRIAVLVSAVFAAMATPAADVVSMLLLAGILVALYFLATSVAFLFDRRRARLAPAPS